MRRRRFLGAVIAGTTSLAGCSGTSGSSSSGESGGGSGSQITPVTPNDDGKGSPGELRYLLEQKNIAVEYMAMQGEEIRLAYASEATSLNEFVDEVGKIGDRFALYVGYDGPGSRLTVLVRDRHQGSDWTQAKGFHIKRTWAKQYDEGSMSGRKYLQKMLNTRKK